MPNYCDYTMKIVGSKDNCKRFVARLNSYEQPNHFFRIFEANVYKEEASFDGSIAYYISGYCAWSIESCCRASGYSGGIDLFEVNTRELELKMEVYSRETEGMFFEEHYIYNNGECLENECDDINVWWWDTDSYPTYEEFKNSLTEEEKKNVPAEECFDHNRDIAIVGGFGDEYEHWHI